MIIRDLLLVELFDVAYYRDLDMWVRGHSRSLKLLQFESLGALLVYIIKIYIIKTFGFTFTNAYK